MKRYTIEDAAKSLGIDTETLGGWLSSAHLAAFPDPRSNEYVLDEQQLDQLARQHGLQVNRMSTREASFRLQQEDRVSDVPTAHLQQGNAANPVPASPPPPKNGGPASNGAKPVPFVRQVPQQTVTGQLPMANGKAHNVETPDVVPEVRPIKLNAPVITIGRFPTNMVVLDNPQVSGCHARLEQLPGGGHQIFDLHSTNHVYVNSQRVREKVLQPGDEISIGAYQFTYTGDQLVQAGEGYSIRIDGLHLKQYGKWHVTLLNDVSLDVPQHSLVALVGSSGVGKTTLLDALSGIRPAAKGTVLYNGRDYYRNLPSFNTQIGYVPQSDIIHKDLTVQHALYYTARLRLPRDFTRKQIKERINEVLDEVEMAHRRRMLVGRLSGGERKRVSLALELLANPSVWPRSRSRSEDDAVAAQTGR